MSSSGTKSVNAVHTGKPHRLVQTAVNVQKSTNLDMLIALLMSPYTANVDTLDTGKQNAEEVPLLTGNLTSPHPPGGTDNKGRKVGLTLLISMTMTANMIRLTCTQSMMILMRLRWMTW